MGVLGLTPFIQKTCPEVIKTLPNRLREFAGKTVVIDGTLITQRLHFAPTPQQYRHVLGWYRIVRELQECGVRAICVFDGKERSLAKELEMQRRRAVRRATEARGELELARLDRLRRLEDLLGHWRGLEPKEQERTTDALRKIVGESTEPLNLPSYMSPTLTEALSSRLAPDAPANPAQVVSSEEAVGSVVEGDLTNALKPVSPVESLSTVEGEAPKGSMSVDEGNEAAEDFKGVVAEESEREAAQKSEGEDLEEENAFVEEEAEDLEEETIEDFDEELAEFPDSKGAAVEDPQAKEEALQSEDAAAEALQLEDTSAEALDPGSLFAGVPAADDQAEPIDIPLPDAAPQTESAVLEAPAVDDQAEPFGTSLSDAAPQAETAAEPAVTPILEPSPAAPPEDLLAVEHAKKVPSEAPSNEISQSLAELYLQYRLSVPQLEALPEQPTMEAAAAIPVMSPADAEATAAEAKTEYAMSRTQHQLMLDEGQLWAHLAASQAGTVEEGPVAALAQKSTVVSESYQRRTHPPTGETYEQSKEILRAMGVPCIVSTGPFEAEALASSLVINGYADYVASEDTDVLVYDAPMIRNISNRNGPIVLISGADVRSLLALDRERFIDFALLLGTDFSPRIKNVGPARALALIRAHGCIEQVLTKAPRFTPRCPPDVYLEQVVQARMVFTTLPPVPTQERLRPREVDEEVVAGIMAKYGLASEMTEDWDSTVPLTGNFFGDNPAAC